MMQPFQNESSAFGRLAQLLIARRLRQFNINALPEDFFPISDQLKSDLAAAEAAVRKEAEDKYGPNKPDQISDHIYKYKRATIFAADHRAANRPEYSGFQTLVYLSTGVIRNLLQPCYWMYEKMLSEVAQDDREPVSITSIPPTVQSETIIERSRELWDWLRKGLDQNIVDCSSDDAKHAYQLLDQLAILFRERLMRHQSEPALIHLPCPE